MAKNKLEESKTIDAEIPKYLVDVYNWAYVKPKNIDMLDNIFVYHTILFGQGGRLMNAYLSEMKKNDRVLQVAHVYGNLVKKIANKIGKEGQLDIIDVVPHQLVRANKKLEGCTNYKTWIQNATTPYVGEYDIIGIYFLLHEIPDDMKTQVIENALAKIDENGSKVVFIDYGAPHPLHPIKPILFLVNKYLEPFASIMWKKEISDFTTKASNYKWEKTPIFGGVYQKVVVTKK